MRSNSSRCGAPAKRGLHLADLLHQVGGDVVRHVGVHGVRRRPRRVQADHRRQDLVADRDPGHGVLCQVAALRDDHHDRLADVIHLVLRQRVAGARGVQGRVRDQHRQRLAGCARQVLVGVDRHHAVDVERVGDVDVDDPGVGVRRPQECRLQRRAAPDLPARLSRPHLGADVVGVASLPGDQPEILGAPDRGAEVALCHQVSPPSGRSPGLASWSNPSSGSGASGSSASSAARSTAATMF